MNRTQKQAEIDQLKQMFEDSNSFFLVKFSGLKVNDATELRKQIRAKGSGYRVVKNTLARRALEGSGLEAIGEHFTGPVAVAFTATDPVALAKALTTYAKLNPAIGFKAGVVEGKVISEQDIKAVAELPSREELLGRLVNILSSPMRRLVTVLSAPQRNLVNVVKAHADKKS